MRNDSLICALPDNIPAFICNHNGSIVFLNKLAEDSFGDFLSGKNMADLLSSRGKLQFEIAMKSKVLRPFTDKAECVSNYPYLSVIPGNISFYKIATVVFLQNAEDFTPDYSPMPVEMLSRIINSLLSPNFNSSTDYDALFDAQKAVSRIKEHLNNNSFLPNKTVFSDDCIPAEQHTYICDCPLHSFTSLITALAYIADSCSTSGDATIKLSYCQQSFEVKIETRTQLNAFANGYDSVVSLLPSCRIAADICKFIAESNSCDLDAKCNEDDLAFIITFNYPDYFADFKSNDPFKDFDDMFYKICCDIITIYKEEEQE